LRGGAVILDEKNPHLDPQSADPGPLLVCRYG
jgi:hypothetical protein